MELLAIILRFLQLLPCEPPSSSQSPSLLPDPSQAILCLLGALLSQRNVVSAFSFIIRTYPLLSSYVLLIPGIALKDPCSKSLPAVCSLPCCVPPRYLHTNVGDQQPSSTVTPEDTRHCLHNQTIQSKLFNRKPNPPLNITKNNNIFSLSKPCSQKLISTTNYI